MSPQNIDYIMAEQQQMYDTIARDAFIRAGYRSQLRRLRRSVRYLWVMVGVLSLSLAWTWIVIL